jgi:hypothetical protein
MVLIKPPRAVFIVGTPTILIFVHISYSQLMIAQHFGNQLSHTQKRRGRQSLILEVQIRAPLGRLNPQQEQIYKPPNIIPF